MTTFNYQELINIFNRLLEHNMNGIIEPETFTYNWFNIINIDEIINRLVIENNAKIVLSRTNGENNGIIIIWLYEFYFAIDYQRNANNLYIIYCKLCYFINNAEKFLNISEIDEDSIIEPIGPL